MGIGCTRSPESQPLTETESSAYIPFPAADSLRIDSFFLSLHRRGKFNGVVLHRQQNRLFAQAYGWANYRKRDTLSVNDPFQLASVSKPLTAYAVMLLVEEGNLHLTDSVGQFFPGWPYPGITLEMLLTHTSGLPEYMYVTDSVWTDKSIPMCTSEAVEALICTHPERYYTPGSRYNYRNTNYLLLARIVELVSGMSFESFMQSRVFAPLEMEQTYVASNYADLEGSQPAHTAGHNAYLRPKIDFYLNGASGDKGVFSTVFDLLRFDEALTSEGPLSPEYVHEMEVPRVRSDRKGTQYGYGWRVRETVHGTSVIFHNGWWRGYRSYFIRVPDYEATWIILSNTMQGPFLKQDSLLNLAQIK